MQSPSQMRSIYISLLASLFALSWAPLTALSTSSLASSSLEITSRLLLPLGNDSKDDTRSLQEVDTVSNETTTNGTVVEEEDHGEGEDHGEEEGHTEEEGHEDEHDDHDHEDEHDDHDHEDEHDDQDHEDEHGNEEHESEHHDDHSKPWGTAILFCFIINLTTLLGVVFLSGEFIAKKVFKTDLGLNAYSTLLNNIIPSFAFGALLATTIFLILPEAIHTMEEYFAAADSHEGHDDHEDHRFLEEEHHEEHEDHAGHHHDASAIWRIGVCVMAGILIPVLSSALFPHRHMDDFATEQDARAADASETDRLQNDAPGGKTLEDTPEEAADAPTSAESTPGASIDRPLVMSILVGDFFHNFADGIFVGTAFLRCDKAFAITVCLATLYHEIAQEIADYFMLTRYGGLSPAKALAANFINGLSVLLGAIIILAMEDMSELSIASILAVSAGIFLYISCVECLPRVMKAHKTFPDLGISFLSFVVGAVPIGLILLNHEHCE